MKNIDKDWAKYKIHPSQQIRVLREYSANSRDSRTLLVQNSKNKLLKKLRYNY